MRDPFDHRKPHLMSYDPEKPSLWQHLREGNLFARVQACVVLFVALVGLLSLAH